MDRQEKKEAIKDFLKNLPSSYVVPVTSNDTGFLIDHEMNISDEEYLELLNEISNEGI